MTEKTDTKILTSDPEVATRALTLLLVDDDLMSREMLLLQLDGVFKRIYVAADGNEGLLLFCDYKPDIVLTDEIMPGLSGLGLMSKIRALGENTPVLLMTTSIDNHVLLEAINLGVERFVPKPFDFDFILRTLENIARGIVNERLLKLHHQQEVELLRYQDAYNSMQQESARRKERHVVRHDLRNQALVGAKGVRWGINVAYSPRDILCGDGYSVRHLFDGRQLIFVVDAMGSGMSASLTTMLATSFFNYQVENLHLWGTFTLRIFLKRFKEYLATMLLEEEVLSCGFLLVDLEKEEIKTALFGLPPLLLRGVDGAVQRIRGENQPLGIYPSETRISNVSLAGVADLLVITDGVSDAPLPQGGSYREILENDFRTAPTLAALLRRFKKNTDQGTSDDMTLLHLRRLDFDSDWNWTGSVLADDGLSRVVHEFLDALTIEVDLDAGARDDLTITLSGILASATEYSGVVLSGKLWRGAEKPLLLLEVQDASSRSLDDAPGAVVDNTSIIEHGLLKISRFCDSLFIIGRRGGLIILKTLEGGDFYED